MPRKYVNMHPKVRAALKAKLAPFDVVQSYERYKLHAERVDAEAGLTAELEGRLLQFLQLTCLVCSNIGLR